MKEFTLAEQVAMKDLKRQYELRMKEQQREAYRALTDEQKEIADDLTEFQGMDFRKTLQQAMESGKYAKPSAFLSAEYEWMFQGWILPMFRNYVLYGVDTCGDWGHFFNQDYYEFRSKSGEAWCTNICYIIGFYALYLHDDVMAYDDLIDNASPEHIAYKYMLENYGIDEMGLAYEIDSGNEACIEQIKKILIEHDPDKMTRAVIQAVVMAHNTELYELLAQTLVSVKLIVGLRRRICDVLTQGTPKAFLTILKVIQDNALFLYSDFISMLGNWTNIKPYNEVLEQKEAEAINRRVLSLAIQCLQDKRIREHLLLSEDVLEIYMALWAHAVYNQEDIRGKIHTFCRKGTRQQMLAAGLLIRCLQNDSEEQALVREMLHAHYNDLDIMNACMLHYRANFNIYALLHKKTEEWQPSKLSTYDFSERQYLDFAPAFSSPEDAKRDYYILKKIWQALDRGEYRDASKRFPWFKKHLGAEHILQFMMVIANMTRDNAVIDDMVTLMSQRDAWDVLTTREAILLMQPQTPVQRKALMNCVTSQDEVTVAIAYRILEHVALTSEEKIYLANALKQKDDGSYDA